MELLKPSMNQSQLGNKDGGYPPKGGTPPGPYRAEITTDPPSIPFLILVYNYFHINQLLRMVLVEDSVVCQDSSVTSRIPSNHVLSVWLDESIEVSYPDIPPATNTPRGVPPEGGYPPSSLLLGGPPMAI